MKVKGQIFAYFFGGAWKFFDFMLSNVGHVKSFKMM